MRLNKGFIIVPGIVWGYVTHICEGVRMLPPICIAHWSIYKDGTVNKFNSLNFSRHESNFFMPFIVRMHLFWRINTALIAFLLFPQNRMEYKM
jgi:hypothetical protein